MTETLTDIVAPDQVVLSARAANHIRGLMGKEENAGLTFRAAVGGGGCSGFQYSFTFDDAAEDDDHLIERDGISVLIDDISWSYLLGSLIDFEDELIGQHFSIKNPNADSTCGCGVSFALKD